MAFEFFRPTKMKATAMLIAGFSIFEFAVTSDEPPHFAFAAAAILMGAGIVYGGYMMLSKLEPYLPAVFRPGRTAPAA